jgi:hypothetical protein
MIFKKDQLNRLATQRIKPASAHIVPGRQAASGGSEKLKKVVKHIMEKKSEEKLIYYSVLNVLLACTRLAGRVCTPQLLLGELNEALRISSSWSLSARHTTRRATP